MKLSKSWDELILNASRLSLNGNAATARSNCRKKSKQVSNNYYKN